MINISLNAKLKIISAVIPKYSKLHQLFVSHAMEIAEVRFTYLGI